MMTSIKLLVISLKKYQENNIDYIDMNLLISTSEPLEKATLHLGRNKEDKLLTIENLSSFEKITPENPAIFNKKIKLSNATHFVLNYSTLSGEKKTISKIITEKQSLLPNNSTPFEQLLALTTARISELSPFIISPFDLANTPKATLPWLAWLFYAEDWSPLLPTNEQRKLIQNSIKLHKEKGTRQSLERALTQLGRDIEIKEWWELAESIDTAKNSYFFNVYLKIKPGYFFTEEEYKKIRKIIDRLKPETTEYKLSLKIKLQEKISIFHLGLAVQRLTLKMDT